MMKRVLVVEDDAALARVLKDNLGFAGFEAMWVADGNRAVSAAQQFLPDVVLLDVMLPGRDGFDLCGTLRRGGRTGVIMITARGQKADKVRGLSLGADDYVTKPFDIEELLARVSAVLRRIRSPVATVTLGTLEIDFGVLRAMDGSRRVNLTHREFEILQYLTERRDSVVHRDELLREVWGYPETPNTRSVDHAMVRLRRKIEPDPRRPRYVHTVHGDGYQLTPDGVSSE
jgi:DNA-binding response OmpR family regulator